MLHHMHVPIAVLGVLISVVKFKSGDITANYRPTAVAIRLCPKLLNWSCLDKQFGKVLTCA